MCQLPIGPRKKSRMSSEEMETLACKTAACCRRVGQGSVRARDTWIGSPPKRALGLNRSVRGTSRYRRHGDNQIHANPQSGGRRSHGVTCLWPPCPQISVTELGPGWRPSSSGGSLNRQARLGSAGNVSPGGAIVSGSRLSFLHQHRRRRRCASHGTLTPN
jgi:hypothetical protein